MNDLKARADDLGPTVRDLGDLAPDLESLFRDLDAADPRQAAPALPALETHAARGASRCSRGCTRSSRELNPILSYFNFHQATIAGFLTNGGADLAADYGTGQRGQTQIGHHRRAARSSAYQYGDGAARLGARQRLHRSRTRSCAR